MRSERFLVNGVRAGAVLAFALLAPGCSRQPGAGRGEAGGPAAGQGPAEVTLEVVSPARFEEIIRSHRSQVVLVDFWATWCAPCREQFPHTVELARRYAKEGLAVISVSLDDPENEDRALEFLRKQGAAFENFRAETGASQESFAAFDLEGGSIPQYRIYDRRGNLKRVFHVDPLAERPFTKEDIARAVKELL